MLNNNDIKHLARSAILYCERTHATFMSWARPRDLWDADIVKIKYYFDRPRFRENVLKENSLMKTYISNLKGVYKIV